MLLSGVSEEYLFQWQHRQTSSLILPSPEYKWKPKVKSTTTFPINCTLQVGSARETIFDLDETINFSFSTAFLLMNVEQLPESNTALRGELLVLQETFMLRPPEKLLSKLSLAYSCSMTFCFAFICNTLHFAGHELVATDVTFGTIRGFLWSGSSKLIVIRSGFNCSYTLAIIWSGLLLGLLKCFGLLIRIWQTQFPVFKKSLMYAELISLMKSSLIHCSLFLVASKTSNSVLWQFFQFMHVEIYRLHLLPFTSN